MDKIDFMQGIHKIQNAYNVKFETEKLKLWYENLKDMPKEKYLKNIDSQIKINPFIPNIAQIRDEKVNNKNQFANYEQREYTEVDFNKLYAN